MSFQLATMPHDPAQPPRAHLGRAAGGGRLRLRPVRGIDRRPARHRRREDWLPDRYVRLSDADKALCPPTPRPPSGRPPGRRIVRRS
jgi:hypothetical protein